MGFVHFSEAFHLRLNELEGGAHGEVEVAGGLEKLFAVGERMAAVGGHGKGGEEEARTLAELLSEGGDLRGGGLAAEQDVGVAGEVFETEIGERPAEVLRGNLFELVCFVEDDGGGFRKNAGVGRVACGEADRSVGEEEMVIDDDEVGFEGAAAHLGDEAAAVVGTSGAEAGVGAGVELVPESAGFGEGGKLSAVAGFGDALPLGNLAVLVDLVEARENGLVAEGEELAAAEVVGAALHVADAQFAEEGFEERHIAEKELVLECLGAGGNNDALTGAERGQQIGEGFAGARAGLDDEMTALGKGALDCFSHFELAGTVFERKRRAGEDSAGREELVESGQGAGWGVGGGHEGAASMIEKQGVESSR